MINSPEGSADVAKAQELPSIAFGAHISVHLIIDRLGVNGKIVRDSVPLGYALNE